MSYPDTAYISPPFILGALAKSGKKMVTDRIPEFWDLLEYFWDKDRIRKWRSLIFADPLKGLKSCFNLISLCPNAYAFWDLGLFALKPLELSSDRKQLQLQFFWQLGPQVKFKADEVVNLLTEPSSSRGLNSVQGCGLSYDLNRPVPIRSGDTFTLTTDDPESRPLPSIELLDMQWVLQRVAIMRGWPGTELDDDSDQSSRLVPGHNVGRTY
jgi:hypothetical protein